MKKVLLSMISLLLLAVMPANAQTTITPGNYIIHGDFIKAGDLDFFFLPWIGNNKTNKCVIDDELNPEGPIMGMTITLGVFSGTFNFVTYPIVNDQIAYSPELYIDSPMPQISTSKYSICGADGSTTGAVTLTKVDKVRDIWTVSDFGLMSDGIMKVLVKNAKLIKDNGNKNKQYAEVTIPEAGFCSFCPVYQNVTIPENVQILTIEDSRVMPGTKDGEAYNFVRTGEVASDAILGWAEGVLVVGEPNATVQFPYTEEPYTELPNNCLIGATTDVTANGTQYAFTLGEDGNPVLHYVKAGLTIRQGKAYYVPSDGIAKAEIVNIVTNDEATAIMNIENDKTINSNAIYNISGQKVSADYKGIVIKNGKKMFVK